MVSHYGDAFGKKNLFVIIDGHDQAIPDGLGLINILRLPHRPASRVQGDRLRARFISKLAGALLQNYGMAIATDVDEFIVVDPATKLSLKNYLATLQGPVISALGLDVAQHLDIEAPIDLDRRFLEQRSFAHLNSRYTKASIICKPLTWGSGMHRVKGHNFKIDPNPFLFHFGMVDYQYALETTRSPEVLTTLGTVIQSAGWKYLTSLGKTNQRMMMWV